MTLSFILDTTIYLPVNISIAINEFKDIATIKLEWNKLIIEGEDKEEIQEIFLEFMNFVTSFWSQHFPEASLDYEDIKNIDTAKIGFFRFKKFNNETYIITNDIGNFHFLSSWNFQLFIQWKVQYLPDHDELLDKGFIKNRKYERNAIEKFRKKTRYIGMWPALHMIVITLRCNHHCKYCHAAVAPETATEFDMSIETATKVVNTILYTNSGNITIEFQWGEALLNWEVVQHVVIYAKEQWFHLKKEINFTLVTNLTLMTEDKLSWLLENGVSICTSLDGNEALHNGNRTWYKWNSFQKVTYWIERINEENAKRWLWKIGALLTTTKAILPKYKEVIDAYLKLGLDGIFLRWLNPYGFAASDLENLAYTPDEWIDFYEKSLDYIIELNRQWIYFKEYITTVYMMKIFMDFDPAYMDIRSPGWMAIWWVAYNYDGKVYASDESRMLGRMWMEDFLLTDMLDTGAETYNAMMNSDVTKVVVQSSTLDGLPWYNDHVYKPYLWVDVLHNFKQTGSLYTPLAKDQKMQIQIGLLDVIFKKLGDPETNSILMSWLDKR